MRIRRAFGVMIAAAVVAGVALSCTSNNTTVVIASPSTATSGMTPSLGPDMHPVDHVCAAITVMTGLLSKDLDLGPNQVQDAVNRDLGIFEGQIQADTGQLRDPEAEAALSDLLYASNNVTGFSGLGGSDEFVNRLETFVKSAQDFKRNYCQLL